MLSQRLILSVLLEREGAEFFQIYPTDTLFYPSTAVHLAPIPDSVKGAGTITHLHRLGRGAHQYSAHRSC